MNYNKKLITKNWDKINPYSIESYIKNGGYQTAKKIIRKNTDHRKIIEIIEKSGLRGRGGGGFPTGKKLRITYDSSISKGINPFFVVNADESQPGAYKDRFVIDNNPHLLIESTILASYAIRAKRAFIYINPNFKEQFKLLKTSIDLAKSKGFLGKNIFNTNHDLYIKIVLGAGGYVYGEETTLINSLEGRRGEPRIRPPFPCTEGFKDKPTVVNNVETVANIAPIIKIGAKKYREYGTEGSPGTKLMSVSGSVNNPGVYEVEFGTTIRDLIHDYCGGLEKGKTLDFVQVGGIGRFFKGKELSYKISYDITEPDCASVGLGQVLVVDKSVDLKKLISSWAFFFKKESCGQCTPCREGTYQLYRIAERFRKNELLEKDWENIGAIVEVLSKTSICQYGNFVSDFWAGIVKLKGKKYFIKK